MAFRIGLPLCAHRAVQRDIHGVDTCRTALDRFHEFFREPLPAGPRQNAGAPGAGRVGRHQLHTRPAVKYLEGATQARVQAALSEELVALLYVEVFVLGRERIEGGDLLHALCDENLHDGAPFPEIERDGGSLPSWAR